MVCSRGGLLDPRITKQAEHIIEYATKTKKDDNVLIQLTDYGIELAQEIYLLAARKGANPLITVTPTETTRQYYDIDTSFLRNFPKHVYELTKNTDIIVSIRGENNLKALSNVEPERMSIRSSALKEIQESRLSKRWCLTQVPTPAYAQEAEMSMSEYEDFVYSAILLDWGKECSAMEKVKEVLDKGRQVHLEGVETDLTMSIEGRTAIIGDATHNVPGGETYTAPVDDSAEGKIYFNFPGIVYGREVRDIRLRFEKGEVVDYSANKNEELLKTMLNIDAGSKRLGELGIGTNYGIKLFTKNILFDEKMGGTIHLALGRAYKECGGVNESAIHWDMIKTMNPGNISIDGRTIQNNGVFSWNQADKL
ncbi:MAG: Aminopeptidase [Thermoproteota archaeon]|nr:Aminopeptidase [Thermoproteota archaeon]